MAARAKEPQRTVRAVVFEHPIGPVTIEDLLAMPEDQWGFLRDTINAKRVVKGNPPYARCLLCGNAVFIKVDALHIRRPLFAHFKRPDLVCQWHRDSPGMDDVRAAQYLGQQESELHRQLCNTLAGLIRADKRCTKLTVAEYRAPTNTEHGRFPDVYAEFDGLPAVTLELQLSRSFAPEIAARERFYGLEKVGLIWVLYGVDPNSPDLAQSFRDIIRRHRGNAFIFDQRAMQASVEAKTLVLWCHRRDANGAPLPPRLTRLDELKFLEKGLPFYDDSRSRTLLQLGLEARKRWWKAERQKPEHWHPDVEDRSFFEPAWASLRYHIPQIRTYRDELRVAEQRTSGHIAAVIFRLLSIGLTAFDGEQRNLATRQTGPSCAVLMLNSSLNCKEFARYGKLFAALIDGTAAKRLLTAPSLAEHFERACKLTPQIEEGHAMWQAARWLFPEVLNPIVRQELDALGTLPDWAKPERDDQP